MIPRRKMWWRNLRGNSGSSNIMAILRLGPSDTFVAAAGAQSAVVASIQTINRLYVDTTAGAASLNNLSSALDGQLLWIVNQGPNALTLVNNSGSPGSGSLFSGNSDVTMLSDDGYLIFFDLALGVWQI